MSVLTFHSIQKIGLLILLTCFLNAINGFGEEVGEDEAVAAAHLVSDVEGTSFQNANRLMLENKYADAIKLYTEVLRERESVSVYHNLGIAYYLNGEHGFAVLHLEKALRLGFGSPNTREILSLLRNSEGISFPRYELLQRLARSLPDFIWFAAMVTSFWLVLILGVYIYGFVNKRSVYRDSAIVCLMIFIITIVGCIGLFQDAQYGVMTAKSNGLKVVPTSESEIFISLKGGEMARLLKSTETHVFLETSSGVRGWLETENFSKIR